MLGKDKRAETSDHCFNRQRNVESFLVVCFFFQKDKWSILKIDILNEYKIYSKLKKTTEKKL
jgi:hypothetical protein